MAQFFISYSRADRPFLDNLTSLFHRVYGDNCLWFDEQIHGGEDWWRVILKEIRECEAFIYLVSDKSLESEWCIKEVREAINRKKPILPLNIPSLSSRYPADTPTDIADTLRRIQYVELNEDYEPRIHTAIRNFKNPLSSSPIDLSRIQRWTLSNQFRILAKLYPDEADEYENMCEIVENGYELMYGWISRHIDDGDEVMSREECLEVNNILDMFRFLKFSYYELTDKSGIVDTLLYFQGFSGNSETKYMTYARFLVKRENGFEDLELDGDFNSHVPVLDLYREMMQEWKASKDPYYLTKEDIIRITSVR